MDEGATQTRREQVSDDASGHDLIVVGKDGPARIPVPENGELVIGRSSESQVRLNSDSVSRRHAVFRARGVEFTIEDLGSANGTLVRGEAAPANRRIPISAGESIQIGDFVLLLRARRTSDRTLHVCSQEYFEVRLTEQCERSRGGGAFFLLRIHAEAREGVDPPQVIAGELRSAQVLGRLQGGEWSVLLLDESEADASLLAGSIARAFEQQGVPAQVKVVGFPRDGTSATALMSQLTSPPDGEAQHADAALVSASTQMIALQRQISQVARGRISVLILGETGVGKDVLARTLHERSERRGPFLRLNCAAFASTLLETELFGHEKGAFTGAVQTKQGLLESAAGGTVFLDEVGELPPELQPKLLLVLESHEVLRVGSLQPRSIDVRFVAATNRDLEQDAGTGRFRSDLYYRLAGFTVFIPPLRERRDEILPLAEQFIRGAVGPGGTPRINAEAARLLRAYAWPGNIRELRNVIERAVVLSDRREITPEHLPVDKMRSVIVVEQRPAEAAAAAGEPPGLDLSAAEREERARIVAALAGAAGNQSRAAQQLGMSRTTLIHKIDALRIPRPRKRPG